MLRFRGSLQALLPCLLFTLLLLMPSCGVEESVPPGSAIASGLLETEAGGVLLEVLAEAGETDRLAFLHTGADW